MSGGKKHLIIGTAVCAATMLLFLAFWGKLPDAVPIQITIDGSVGNTLPKPVFVFCFPIAFAAVNLIKNVPSARTEHPSPFGFYTVPGIALILSALTLCFALGTVGP